jgi:ribonuclease HI
LNKLPTSSAITQRLPNEWRNGVPPNFPPPIPTTPQTPRKPATNLQKITKYTSHDHERIDPYALPPWSRTTSLFPKRFITNPHDPNRDPAEAREDHIKKVNDYQENPNILYIYTDGSKINRAGFFRVGAGASAYHGDREVATGRLGLGGHAEVFDAEMAALSLGATKAEEFIQNSPNITHIAFFTDNAAATSAIVDPKPKTSQYFAIKFHQVIRPLLETHENLSISVSWCPSHCGIPGNERADQLAKEATELERQTPFSATHSNARRRAKTSILKLWQIEWKNSPKVGRYAIANRIKPSLNPTQHFKELKNKREIFGRVIQCRTGHSYTGEFRQAFLPLSPDPTACPCDPETLETRNHILRECPRFAQHHHILKKVSRDIVLSDILGTKKGIAALADFIHKSGAFTRTGAAPNAQQPPNFENEPEPAAEDDPRLVHDDWG